MKAVRSWLVGAKVCYCRRILTQKDVFVHNFFYIIATHGVVILNL